MKIAILASLFVLSLSVVWAGGLQKKTLTLRFQPPAEAIENTDQCGVTEAAVTKAVKSLEKNLRKEGMDVQLGTLPRADGAGRLWIDRKPLETWLEGADLSRVTSDQIVEAGMAAAAILKGTAESSGEKSTSANSGTVGISVAR